MRLALALACLALPDTALAHYGMVIPSDPLVAQEDPRTLTLTLAFAHPFEMTGMDLATPAAFGVVARGARQDLLGTLKAQPFLDRPAFTADFQITEPGTYVFHLEPQPYWEPAEDAFILHYTKAYVTAFGDDEGWDSELGLKTEIVPLSKPFGLYAGNVFQGIVKRDGQPVPNAEVEIEHYNQDRSATAPSEIMITQTVKADGNGVFTYAAPVAGWWGFAALTTADYTLPRDGVAKPVELGAVLWVRFEPWGAK